MERTIETVKKVMIKAIDSRTDLNMALLGLRTTPVDAIIPSPAEMLNGRKQRGNLPVIIKNSTPRKDEIYDRMLDHQESQRDYHNRSGIVELLPLKTGQKVTVQNTKNGTMVTGNSDEQRVRTKVIHHSDPKRTHPVKE